MSDISSPLAAITPVAEQRTDNFQRYYEEAGPDYAAWSPSFNMHFGFFRSGMNPINREALLEQMNREVLDRLRVPVRLSGEAPRILDMGCGLGATLRSFAHRLPAADLTGITLVPWQLEHGRHLNQSDPQVQSIHLSLDNYEHTAFAAETFDAVCAIRAVATALAPIKRD